MITESHDTGTRSAAAAHPSGFYAAVDSALRPCVEAVGTILLTGSGIRQISGLKMGRPQHSYNLRRQTRPNDSFSQARRLHPINGVIKPPRWPAVATLDMPRDKQPPLARPIHETIKPPRLSAVATPGTPRAKQPPIVRCWSNISQELGHLEPKRSASPPRLPLLSEESSDSKPSPGEESTSSDWQTDTSGDISDLDSETDNLLIDRPLTVPDPAS